MIDVKKIADAADVIVNGYAFTSSDGKYKILNLNRPDKAAVATATGEIIETNMDDIEIKIVSEYLARNLKFMEE